MAARAPPPGRLLAQFVGHPAYGLAQLRGDLEPFIFLLGGSDGEPLLTLARLSKAPHHDQPAGPDSTEGGGFAAAYPCARRASCPARSGI